MNTPPPLAAVWQASYLHQLDQMAQDAADTALAALEPNADAGLTGIRFVHAYRKLHKHLEPFRRHDSDRPASWPAQADPGVLFASLRLLAVLEKLAPPAEPVPQKWRGKKQVWFDGEDAAVNLKEQGPTVRRLLTTAEDVHQLIAKWLICTRSNDASPDGKQTGQVRRPSADVGLPTAEQPPSDKAAEPSVVQKALAVIAANPGWSVTRIAKEVGCSRGHLYRLPIIKAALQASRGSKRVLPRGFKDREGNLDAWDEGD